MSATNLLFRGDNLAVLRRHIGDETVDLSYIDPPFHSKRNYSQVHNRVHSQAFTDTWCWDERAAEAFDEILSNAEGRYQSRTVDLMRGLRPVVGAGGLLAYLAAAAQRLAEIHRVLKPTGSLFLHCDPTASHYLKLLLDAIFCQNGGGFRNEIVWCYSHGGKGTRWFGRKHDVILFYSKSANYQFNPAAVRVAMRSGRQSFGGRLLADQAGREYRLVYGTKNAEGKARYYKYYLDEGKLPEDWWTDINSIQASSAERLGYPTQKPEALLRRIIDACSKEGDLVLDAYCGSGTALVAAERGHRAWIGIDLSEPAISLVLRRMQSAFGRGVLERITVAGA